MLRLMFWKQALERAVKTAAQTAILVIGADKIDASTIDWSTVGWFALGGALLSVLTSVASEPFGPSDSPSVLD